MPYIQIEKSQDESVSLYYQDRGSGDPVMLLHAWPLTSRCWERQVEALLDAGHRVIVYDRRGFGRSSRPESGYDYCSLAFDLSRLIESLDLHRLTLVGFSMGGGEIAKYLSDFGTKRISKAVFLASVPPQLLKSNTNPSGVEQLVLDKMIRRARNEKEVFLREHLSSFYNQDQSALDKTAHSFIDECLKNVNNIHCQALTGCIEAWKADLLPAFSTIRIPTLILHGEADQLLPLSMDVFLNRTIEGSRCIVVKGGSHGFNWTHSGLVNSLLVDFLKS